jgi:hypothetical protein
MIALCAAQSLPSRFIDDAVVKAISYGIAPLLELITITPEEPELEEWLLLTF